MEERKSETNLFLQNSQNWRINTSEHHFQESLKFSEKYFDKRSIFNHSKRYALKNNLTIGFPENYYSPNVLCEWGFGFHKGCTDEPDEKYDVLAHHNNWERLLKYFFA